MFDVGEMQRVVTLQSKSFLLLRWVNESLKARTLTFGVVHEAMSLSEAAIEWLYRHFASLPLACRPVEEDLQPFAHLFVSYLTTSYQLREEPGMVRVADKGRCYCRFCAYLVAANHLVVRTPDKKAMVRAQEMKDLYLASLAQDVGVILIPAQRESLRLDAKWTETLAYATYGRELLRRSEFASQGEGILVLWREFAWHKGKLKKGFTLSAERILAAEQELVAYLPLLNSEFNDANR